MDLLLRPHHGIVKVSGHPERIACGSPVRMPVRPVAVARHRGLLRKCGGNRNEEFPVHRRKPRQRISALRARIVGQRTEISPLPRY